MSDQASYPRPDFTRPSLNWTSLNGPWDFYFDDTDIGLAESWHLTSPPKDSRRTIQVPFAFQAPASGINEQQAHEVLWYERLIKDIRTAEEKAKRNRIVLRFGAVDYDATIWVNGQYVGGHRGGHVPFDVDISDAIGGEKADAKLTLRVRDSPYDLTQPRGKQYWGPEPESIFYTPSSGIWQNVWLESVPITRIGNSSEGTVFRSDDIDSGVLHATVAVLGRKVASPCTVEVVASFRDVTVTSVKGDLPRDREAVSLDLNLRLDQVANNFFQEAAGADATNPYHWRNTLALWSPEKPQLYDLIIRVLDPNNKVVDEVHTTTGMRSIDWLKGDSTFRLNDKPIFQSLCLDQGYWPETLMTPPSADHLKQDIQLSKAIGFNGCRKHQKVEDPIFLYWADKLGYLVWGEIANAYEFSADFISRFNQEWTETVKRDINHPSIVAWTPVNESWAYKNLKTSIEERNHIRQLYYLTKTLDPTRPINDNCGWEHVITDLTTFHEYADGPKVEEICETLPGIIHRMTGETNNRAVFLSPIFGAGAVVVDPGSSHKSGAPVICSEFGGVNIAPSDKEKKGDKDWGYTTASDPEDLLKRLEKLVFGVVKGRHCCGLVYTQLTDIEQEVNGLYSYDRRAKVDPARVKAIFDKAAKIYLGEAKA